MSFFKNKLSRGHSMRVPADEVCAHRYQRRPLAAPETHQLTFLSGHRG